MVLHTKQKFGGDVIRHLGNEGVVVNSIALMQTGNPIGNVVDMPAGYPIALLFGNFLPMVSLLEGFATIVGMLIRPVRLLGGAYQKVSIVTRGPVAIYEQSVPTTDISGEEFAFAGILAGYRALGFVVRKSVITTERQET